MYLVLKSIFALLSLIPLKVRGLVGNTLGLIYAYIPSKEKYIAKLQLKKILKAKNPNQTTKKIFQNLGQNFFEAINFHSYLKKSSIECNNPELLEDLLNSKQSIVALTAHAGNWDLLAAHIVNLGGKLITIGRPMRNSAVQKILDDLRKQYGIVTIWRNNKAETRSLVNSVKEGCIVGALIDQDTKVKSAYSKFFDLSCKTPTSLIELGIKHNCRFCSAFIFKDGQSFKFFLSEIKASDIDSILTDYHAKLEELVRSYPEQWVWFHKRWRSQSEEKTMSGFEYIKFLEAL